ncbi:MAG: LPS export ABC transporter periplasmic protein LptC [Deltaproteobacteria bacterium]|nr:LPS export ABC transporter periplasmic protein LptC [Deltaproteobacteria bacterium]
MNITRSQSIVLGIGTLVLFFAASIIMLKFNQGATLPESSTPKESPRASLSQEDLKSAVTLDNFQRSESRDGRKIWEVKASKGRYIPESGTAVLEQANLDFFRDDGTQVQLKATNAVLHLEGTSLLSADVTNGVELIHDENTHVYAETATYDHIGKKVHIPGAVKIVNEKLEISGITMTALLDSREFTIEENVSTVVSAKK